MKPAEKIYFYRILFFALPIFDETSNSFYTNLADFINLY